MPITNESTVLSFDATEAFRTVQNVVQGTLYSFIEFTVHEFNPIYVADETLAMYDNREQMQSHFDRIHTHVHMDFMEINSFVDNLFPVANDVRHITTTTDLLKILRVYLGDDGLFLALEPDEPVVPIVEAIRRTIGARA